jgi:peroxiredoxin Q/BCP
MMPLVVGDKGPKIHVRGDSSEAMLPYGDSLTLIFFYPTNQGTTCVTEILDFDRRLSQFSSLGVRVAGVTTDELSQIRELVKDKRLSIPLFNDPEGRGSGLYGVRNAYGFSDRYTFLISKDGFVTASWQAYDTSGHAEEVLCHCRDESLP